MHLMVRRGGDRKADEEKDKFRNAIIANCVKKILNSQKMNINYDEQLHEAGKMEQERMFTGQLTDYGWLEKKSQAKGNLWFKFLL